MAGEESPKGFGGLPEAGEKSPRGAGGLPEADEKKPRLAGGRPEAGGKAARVAGEVSKAGKRLPPAAASASDEKSPCIADGVGVVKPGPNKAPPIFSDLGCASPIKTYCIHAICFPIASPQKNPTAISWAKSK